MIPQEKYTQYDRPQPFWVDLQKIRDCLNTYNDDPNPEWLTGTTLILGNSNSSRSTINARLCRLISASVDELHVFHEPKCDERLLPFAPTADFRPVLHSSSSPDGFAAILNSILADISEADPPLRALFSVDDYVWNSALDTAFRSAQACGCPALVTAMDILDVSRELRTRITNVIITDRLTLHTLLAREGGSAHSRRGRRGRLHKRSRSPLGMVRTDCDRILRRVREEEAVWLRRSGDRVIDAYKFAKTGAQKTKLVTLLF
jgi:hypothetical protein